MPGGPESDLFSSAIRPMLAVSVGRPFDSPDHLFEVKWDGYRCLAFIEARASGGGPPPATAGDTGRVRLQSRNLLDMTAHYPDLAVLPRHLSGRRAIIDGEIIAWGEDGPDFGRLHRAQGPFCFVAFDLLYHDGVDLMPRPLWERREMLARVLSPGDRVVLSDAIAERGEALYQAIVQKDLEGMMAKARLSPYLPGKRSPYWIKVRNVKRLDCVICGYTRGRNFGHFGALILGVNTAFGLTYVGHAGTGFDGEEVKRLLGLMAPAGASPFAGRVPREIRKNAHWADPRLVCEIEYTEITADGRLRHPTYRGLRSDKQPSECTLEEAR
ncbi:MAG TPA: non-homologous end-joining DNA ligase [Bacillota bacterium]|jgi:DNA ligase-1